MNVTRGPSPDSPSLSTSTGKTREKGTMKEWTTHAVTIRLYFTLITREPIRVE